MSEETTDLIVKKLDSNEQFLSIINESYPVEIQEKISDVINIISEEKQITDLFPEILADTTISTSQFQDKCVQYEQHFTPHKKLRQCMLELQNNLNALYAVKSGHKKAILKNERIKLEIENIEEEINNLDEDNNYTKKRLKLSLMEKQVDLEESNRNVNSSSHLVKDSLLKVIQHKELVKKYKEEVNNSDLSFEESEVEYYVMFFTNDVEKQLRTNNRIDTGTFGAISQLPEEIRKKVLSNISFIKHKLYEENYPEDGDFICKVFYDTLRPKKTGENEMEGMKLDDFIGVKTLTKLIK